MLVTVLCLFVVVFNVISIVHVKNLTALEEKDISLINVA